MRSPSRTMTFEMAIVGRRRSMAKATILARCARITGILTTAYSHSLYNEDVHVDVGLAQLFQRGIVRVVVPCLSQFKRRKLQDDDGEGRLAFQGEKARRGVAPDQPFAAVFCYQSARLREIFLCPCRPPRL